MMKKITSGFQIKDAYDWGYLFLIINCGIGESTWFGDLSILLKWPLLIGTFLMFGYYAIGYFNRNPKDIRVYLVIILLGIYNYYLVGSAWILYAILLVLFNRHRDPYHFVKITYISMAVIFAINMVVFFFQYNFSPKDLVIVKTLNGVKYSMSFSSANEAARYWIYLVFLWYYLHPKVKIFNWIIIFIGSITMLHFTESDAIYFILILFLMHILRNISSINKLICEYSRFSFLALGLLSYVLAVLQHPLMYWLDSNFFTGRLSQIVTGLYIYGISWFGNPIDTFALHTYNGDTRPLYLDNGYGFMMIKTGVIYMFLICLVFVFSQTKHKYILSMMILLYALMTLAENNILHPTAIFPIVLAYSNSSFTLKAFINK